MKETQEKIRKETKTMEQENFTNSKEQKHKMRKTFKNEIGITLIALVVTIVVLLILAGITINLLFSNGGIFKTAEDAADAWNKAVINEQESLDNIADQIANLVNGTGGSTVTPGEDTEVPDVLERYLLGEDKTGIPITDIFDMQTMKFKDNAIISDASTSVTFSGNGAIMSSGSEGVYAMSIEYKDNIYTGLALASVVNPNLANASTMGVIKPKITGKKKIYEGAVDLTTNKSIDLDTLNLSEPISPAKKYMLDLTINGVQQNLVTFTFWFINFRINTSNIQISNNNNILSSDYTGTVVLNGIYEIGESESCVEENGFIAYGGDLGSISEWKLMNTPDTNYEIPETVAGKKLTSVYIDLINGYPTFNFPVELEYVDLIWRIPKLKITTPDLDFFFTAMEEGWTFETPLQEVDLSECGDNITIPEEFLTGYADTTIYVSSAVKEKYQDYANVVVK